MLTLGIDDAGRGPIIGPMILAGCLLDKETEKKFKKIGIKDSKQLTHKRREFFAEIIRKEAQAFEIVIASASEIDEQKLKGIKLNELEAIKIAKIINKINKDGKKMKVIVDCPSPNIGKWTDYLKTKVNDLSNLEISCEHKADRNHISVSAASVLAKSMREKEMDKLRKKYGDEIGSGYTSDPMTSLFLKKHSKKYSKDKIFRKTWSTWEKMHAKKTQKKLGDF